VEDGTIAMVIALISTAIAIASLLLNGRISWRKDKREQESHVDAEADRHIELLEKRNGLLEQEIAELKKQGGQREAEWRKRETEWRKREASLEERVRDIERDYRDLVRTVTSMGYCADVKSCKNHNPGDRRIIIESDIAPGGTD
jgi:Skp family chaperone for outer membrane proteins